MSPRRSSYPFLFGNLIAYPVIPICEWHTVQNTFAIGISRSRKIQDITAVRLLSSNAKLVDSSTTIVSKTVGIDDSAQTTKEKGTHTFRSGIAAFMDYVHQYAPDFEFCLMPQDATITLVFRPKSNQKNEWGAIALRVAAERDGRHSFQRVHQGSLTDEVFLFDVDQSILYFVNKATCPNYIAVHPKSDLYLPCRISHANVTHVLKEYFTRDSRRPRMEWLLVQGAFSCRGYPKWAESMYATIKDLYHPLGISVSFPLGDANVMLDGRIKLVQHTLVAIHKKTGHTKYYMHFRECLFPMDVDVDFFLSVGYCANKRTITELFVFPVRVIGEHCYLRDVATGVVGKRCMTLYPPGVKTYTAKTAALQAWQSEFYIDLSNQDDLEKNRRRFQEILGLI